MATRSSSVLTFEQFAEALRSMVTTIIQTVIGPAGDVTPVMVVQDVTGAGRLPIDLTPYLHNGRERDTFLLSLPTFVDEAEALRVVLVMPGWRSVWEPNADGSIPDVRMDRPNPEDDPNRSEVVSVYAAERGRIESWTTELHRRPGRAPRMSAWAHNVDTNTPGTLLDALRACWKETQ